MKEETRGRMQEVAKGESEANEWRKKGGAKRGGKKRGGDGGGGRVRGFIIPLQTALLSD